jgi:hypothetical protein
VNSVIQAWINQQDQDLEIEAYPHYEHLQSTKQATTIIVHKWNPDDSSKVAYAAPGLLVRRPTAQKSGSLRYEVGQPGQAEWDHKLDSNQYGDVWIQIRGAPGFQDKIFEPSHASKTGAQPFHPSPFTLNPEPSV